MHEEQLVRLIGDLHICLTKPEQLAMGFRNSAIARAERVIGQAQDIKGHQQAVRGTQPLCDNCHRNPRVSGMTWCKECTMSLPNYLDLETGDVRDTGAMLTDCERCGSGSAINGLCGECRAGR